MTFKEKLSCIQQEMKAPKNLRNTFGNYNYRNAEGILEAFKPFESKYKVGLTLTDKVEIIGDRIYITAGARLFDCESDEDVTVLASAREAAEKKGMDAAQVTGATSSYARKYALNGLFLLDDTKDPDTDEYQKESQSRSEGQKKASAKGRAQQAQPEPTDELVSDKDIAVLRETFKSKGIDEAFVIGLYKIEKLEGMRKSKYTNMVKNIDKIKEKQEEKK